MSQLRWMPGMRPGSQSPGSEPVYRGTKMSSLAMRIARARRRANATAMKSIRHLTIGVIAGISLLGRVSTAQPPTVPPGNCRYFRETGHYVCKEFLDFFQTQGGLAIFGYPITEAFVDPTHNALRVQYFQRARMEEHPDNEPPYDLQLGLLVDELGYTYPSPPPEEPPPPGDPSQHYFPETQHIVSYPFLDYFRDRGGLRLFGYPRSDMIYEDGLVVQYFQRARMEWHRGNPPGRQIVLTNVGEMYIERFGVPGDPDRRQPPPPSRGETRETMSGWELRLVHLPLILVNAEPSQPPPAVPVPTANVTELDASASVRYPITGRTGTQTVFIYVNDQRGRPVAGAGVELLVHYKSGDVTCIARLTDASGFTRCSFEIPSPPVGKQVVIDITVAYQGMTTTTQTSFVPWW